MAEERELVVLMTRGTDHELSSVGFTVANGAVSVGLRDEQTERVEIVSGVQAGDQLVVGASQGMSPGTPVKLRQAASGV